MTRRRATQKAKPLTDRQRYILGAIREHWRLHGVSPTIREVMAATGLTSTNAVNDHVCALRAKGALATVAPFQSRSFIPTAEHGGRVVQEVEVDGVGYRLTIERID